MTHGPDAAERLRSLGRHAGRGVAASPLNTPLRGASLAGRVPRALWARLPVSGVFDVATAGVDFHYDGSADDVDARQLYWRGLKGIEPETLCAFQDEIIGAGVVVDVGANRGIYTLTALAVTPGTRVVALEASPRTFQHLTAQVAFNGWDDRVTAINSAAGDTAGTLPFHVPKSLYDSSARLVSASHRSAITGDIINVPVVALDDVVPEADVVKIDVEGAEHLVLAGMSRLLRTSKPAVFIEVLPESENEACETMLSAAGYEFFHLTSTGPLRRSGLIPDPDRQFRNYLCRPSTNSV